MGCDLFNKKALNNLATLKGLKLKKANFSIICSDLSDLSEKFNKEALNLLKKQIIQLLRCYNKNNKILILDEPTSALDSTTKTAVINIIKDISKDSTLIIITHDETNLKLTNKTIKIVNGKIVN